MTVSNTKSPVRRPQLVLGHQWGVCHSHRTGVTPQALPRIESSDAVFDDSESAVGLFLTPRGDQCYRAYSTAEFEGFGSSGNSHENSARLNPRPNRTYTQDRVLLRQAAAVQGTFLGHLVDLHRNLQRARAVSTPRRPLAKSGAHMWSRCILELFMGLSRVLPGEIVPIFLACRTLQLPRKLFKSSD